MALLMTLVLACGGDDDSADGPSGRSGLQASLTLSELTETQVRQYCEWEVGLMGTGDEMSCGDAGTTVIGQGDVDECVEGNGMLFADCGATVEDAEDCLYEALADPCLALPAEWQACEWVDDCVPRGDER